MSAPVHSVDLLARPRYLRPRVLVITVDMRLYATVLSSANSKVWQVGLARSLTSALDVCRPGTVPIVIYDEDLPGYGWREAFDCLKTVPNRPRALLAARAIDEQLWRAVLHRSGYDVVARTADSVQVTRALRFAWLSLQEPSPDPIGI